MSLAERLSSLEEVERQRAESPGESSSGEQRRKLSFNPAGIKTATNPQDEPVGAFEVSQTRRILQVAVAVISCLFATGIVFGYAAIKPVFILEGVYRKYCTQDELDQGVRVCFEQELRLNFMFTLAAVSTNIAALPVGTILDRYGPRVCGIIGASFFAMGCFFLAFAWDLPFDGYIIGYFLLALGGPFVFIPSFQLSNAFPRYSGLILALLTGAFDTSSAIFLFYRLIYVASNNNFWPKKFFLVYLVVPAFVLITQIFFMPHHSYKSVGELVTQAEDELDANALSDGEDEATAPATQQQRRERRESILSEITELLGSKNAQKQIQKEETKRHVSGVWGALHGKTAAEQMATPWFVLVTLFTVVQMTRINYFVATIRPQYEHLLGDFSKAVSVNNFFDAALPLGGVISVPFIGMLLDNTSTPLVLGVLVSTATAIGVLGVLPQMWAAYANVCLFVVFRPLYYTAISDYTAKVFGFASFGQVYGLIICLAGLFNFSQSGFDALTHKVFANDPVPVNLLLLGMALVAGLALWIYVWRQARTVGKAGLRQEAEEAEERLMPGAQAPEGGANYGTLQTSQSERGEHS